MRLLVLTLDLRVRAWRLRVARVLVTLSAAGAEVRGTTAATQVLARLLLLSALARGLGALASSLLLAHLQRALRLVAHA